MAHDENKHCPRCGEPGPGQGACSTCGTPLEAPLAVDPGPAPTPLPRPRRPERSPEERRAREAARTRVEGGKRSLPRLGESADEPSEVREPGDRSAVRKVGAEPPRQPAVTTVETLDAGARCGLSIVSADDGRALLTFAVHAEKVLIGRSDDADIVLDDPKVSREHALLVHTAKGFLLVECRSENGIWLGERSVQHHFLADGDVFRVGRTRLRFRTTGRSVPDTLDDDAGAPETVADPRPRRPPRTRAARARFRRYLWITIIAVVLALAIAGVLSPPGREALRRLGG
ncbi:MAG: FHA domain-containing protein [Myxococcales bacterium]|nr:FHA domain-containing protein [Myxococcales bacterium]